MECDSVRLVKAIDELTYPELPTHYRFDKEERVWVTRKKAAMWVVCTVHPSAGDRFSCVCCCTTGQ